MAQQPRGIRNNNPLNIRKGNDWIGERHPQTDKAFEEFESIELGLRAGFIIIFNYIRKLHLRPRCNTPAEIIRRWAPPSENHTQRYLDVVCKRSKLVPGEVLVPSDKDKLCRLVAAMCFVECGLEIPMNLIEKGYELATKSI